MKPAILALLSWPHSRPLDPPRDHHQRRPGSGQPPRPHARRRLSLRRRLPPPRRRRHARFTPPHRPDPHPLQQRLVPEHPQGPRPGRQRLRLRDPGRARPLGFRRPLVPLRRRTRGRVRHPGLDFRAALEQRPYRHVRPLLPGFRPVAQRPAEPPQPHLPGPQSICIDYLTGLVRPGGAFQLGVLINWGLRVDGRTAQSIDFENWTEICRILPLQDIPLTPAATWNSGTTGSTCPPPIPTGPPSTPAPTGTTSPFPPL